MREFDFKVSAAKALTNDIVNMLGYIHEYKGRQNLFIEAKADVLSHLLELQKNSLQRHPTALRGFTPQMTAFRLL